MIIMFEPKLALNSGLECWIGFKHSEMRGKGILAEERKKGFYGLHGFIAI